MINEMIVHLKTGQPITNQYYLIFNKSVENPLELLEILENDSYSEEIKDLALQHLKTLITRLFKSKQVTDLQLSVQDMIVDRIKNNTYQNYRYYELVALITRKPWDEIYPNMESVIMNSSNFRELFSTLQALVKIFQTHEYLIDHDHHQMNTIADRFLPLLADLMFKLLSSYSELTSRLVSKILKIYQCSVHMSIQSYAKQSVTQWNQYFCLIINKGNQNNVKWTTRIFSRIRKYLNFDPDQNIIDCVPLIIQSCYNYLLNQENLKIKDNTYCLKNIYQLLASILQYANTQTMMLNYITPELMSIVIYSIQFDIDLRTDNPIEYLKTSNDAINDLHQLRYNGSDLIRNIIALHPQFINLFINEIKYSIQSKQYLREAALLFIFSELNNTINQSDIEQVLNLVFTEFNSPQAIIREITCFIFGSHAGLENCIVDLGCQKLMERLQDSDLVVRATAATALGQLTTNEFCRNLIYEQMGLVCNVFINLITETELEQVVDSFLKVSEIGLDLITPYAAKLITYIGNLFMKKIPLLNGDDDDEDTQTSLICNGYLEAIRQFINLELQMEEYNQLFEIIKNILNVCLAEGTEDLYEGGLFILKIMIRKSQDQSYLKYYEILTYQIMGINDNQNIPQDKIWQACKSQCGLYYNDMAINVLRAIIRRGYESFLIERDIFNIPYTDLMFTFLDFTIDKYSMEDSREISQVLNLFISFVQVYKGKIDNYIPRIVQKIITLVNQDIDQQVFHLFALALIQSPQTIMDYLHYNFRTDILQQFVAQKLPKNNEQLLNDLLYALCQCMSLIYIPPFFMTKMVDVCRLMIILKKNILNQRDQLTDQSRSDLGNSEVEEDSEGIVREASDENHSAFEEDELEQIDSVNVLDELMEMLTKTTKQDPQYKVKSSFAQKLKFYNSKIQL